MNVEYSRQFATFAYKLSGKYKESLKRIISEIKSANDLSEVSDCIKLAGFLHSYRIKMGDYRVVFTFKKEKNLVFLQLLLSRSEIYKKAHTTAVRRKEKD